jgi:hypothetical protein
MAHSPDHNNQNIVDIKDASGGQSHVDAKTADVLMAHMLDYYVKLHSIVTKKMGHAKSATSERIAELQEQNGDQDDEALNKYKELLGLWDQVLELLEKSGVTTETMEDISAMEESYPQAIRNHYDRLVEMDKALVSLIAEVEDEKYQELYRHSKEITERIQKGKNLMSALPGSEYDQGTQNPKTDEKKDSAPAKNGEKERDEMVIIRNGKRYMLID